MAILLFAGVFTCHSSEASDDDIYYVYGTLVLDTKVLQHAMNDEVARLHQGVNALDSNGFTWGLRYSRELDKFLLTPKIGEVLQNLDICAVYSPTHHFSSNSPLRDPCFAVFKRVLSDNQLRLLKLSWIHDPNDRDLKKLQWYKDRITVDILYMEVKLFGIDDLGTFFTKKHPFFQYIEMANVGSLKVYLFDNVSPHSISPFTFSGFTRLNNFHISSDCGSGLDQWPSGPNVHSILRTSFHRSHPLPGLSGPLPTFSLPFVKAELEVNMPCVLLGDLVLHEMQSQASLLNVRLSFANMGKMMVEKSRGVRSFSDVWGIRDTVNLQLLFNSTDDFSTCNSLPKTFFSANINVFQFTVGVEVTHERKHLASNDKTLSELMATVYRPSRFSPSLWTRSMPSSCGKVILINAALNEQYLEGSLSQSALDTLSLVDVSLDTSTTVQLPPELQHLRIQFSAEVRKPSTSSIGLDYTIDLTHLQNLKEVEIDCTRGISLKVAYLPNLRIVNLDSCHISSDDELSSKPFFDVIRATAVSLNNMYLDGIYQELFPCMNTTEQANGTMGLANACCESHPGSNLYVLLVANEEEHFPRTLAKEMVCHFKKLRSLTFVGNKIEEIKNDFFSVLPSVLLVDLGYNRIRELPSHLIQNVALAKFHVNNNALHTLHTPLCVNSTVGHFNFSTNFIRSVDFTVLFEQCLVRNYMVLKSSLLGSFPSVGIDFSSNQIVKFAPYNLSYVLTTEDHSSSDNFYDQMVTFEKYLHPFTITFRNNSLSSFKLSGVPNNDSSILRIYLVIDLSSNDFTELHDTSIKFMGILHTLNLEGNSISSCYDANNQTLVEYSCLYFGCDINFSWNAFGKATDVDLNRCFRNSAIRSVDLSFNDLKSFPDEIANVQREPYLFELHNTQNTFSVLTFVTQRYFNLTLRGNEFRNLNSPICPWQGEKAGRRRLYIDLSDCNVTYFEPSVFACGEEDSVMANLNRNPLNCIPKVALTSPVSLSLLSLLDTGVKTLPYDIMFSYLNLKSLLIGSSSGRDEALPLCCDMVFLHNSVVIEFSINPEQLNRYPSSNLAYLLEAYRKVKSFPETPCRYLNNGMNNRTDLWSFVVNKNDSAQCVPKYSTTCASGGFILLGDRHANLQLFLATIVACAGAYCLIAFLLVHVCGPKITAQYQKDAAPCVLNLSTILDTLNIDSASEQLHKEEPVNHYYSYTYPIDNWIYLGDENRAGKYYSFPGLYSSTTS